MVNDVLTAAADAERARRQRLSLLVLERAAPLAAAAIAIAALFVRFAGTPRTMLWTIAATAVAAVVALAIIVRRAPAVDDAAARRLDRDGALDGELRSAHWFASQSGAGDAWSAFHVARAAERLAGVSWASIYPRPNFLRAGAASAALVLVAAALVIVPARTQTVGIDAAGAPPDAARRPSGMTAELQKEIDDAIKAVQDGSMPMDAARQKLSKLRDAVATTDPKTQAAIANAMKGKQPSDWQSEDPDPELKALADKAEQAAKKADLPQDMKWAMQDLAQKLGAASRPAADNEQKSGDQARNSQDNANNSDQQASGMAMTRSAASDANSTQVMTSNLPMNGAPADARGLQAPDPGRTGAPLNLAALKKETIQADADSQGDNVLSELRRKSEQSHATIAFSRVAPLAAYDKSHASAPPAPPEALRPLVRQYFIRR